MKKATAKKQIASVRKGIGMVHPNFVFIEPEETTPEKNRLQPASYLRKTFQLPEMPTSAILYTTGLGVYIPYVNGIAVEPARLMPGFTDYRKRVQYFETDVTEYVRKGKNVISAVLGDGWYRGSLGAYSRRAFYGDNILFAGTLKVEIGSHIIWIFTDEETRATQNGPIRGNDIKTFEIVDMTREMPGWNLPDYDDHAWHPCRRGIYDGQVVPLEGNRILEHERFPAKHLITPNGEHVLDFGQNMAGHVEFTVNGSAGVRVMLEMGETLDENGNFTTNNLTEEQMPEICEGMEVPEHVLGQTLVGILKDGPQTYRSAFLNSGFRYVRITGWPEEIREERFTAIAVYADMEFGGDFRCSDERINQMVSNVRWSLKSNFVDIPTDCPTRERAGWAGDVNVFCETACYLADTRKFLTKWLKDFAGLQKADGSLPFLVPEVPLPTESADMMNLPYGSAGWSDALIHVALVLYRFYGDVDILKDIYEPAKRYLAFNVKRAKKRHWLHFLKLRRHYRYILDTGYHWGEWLEPGTSMTTQAIRALTFPDAEVATAWFYHSAKELSEVASVIGEEQDAATLRKLADRIRTAYRKEFLRGGKAHGKRQCRYVRPVAMGLADEESARRIADQLNRMCIKNAYRVGTGFLTTWQVLQVLSDYGHTDTAWRMLTQKQCPGWMYEIEKGATTTWENWMGIDEKGKVTDSQNHYAMGAVVAWLFSKVGGITPLEPGFGKVRICPLAAVDLTWAQTSCRTPWGPIRSGWEKKDGTFLLRLSLPEGITAEVVMPDGTKYTAVGEAAFQTDYRNQ